MTTQEFSNQFDVLYNNVMSNQAPGLDEYEKSVFLTKAQNEIVLSYFNPKTNKLFEGFDGNERRQVDFSMLMKSYESTDFNNAIYTLRNTSGPETSDHIFKNGIASIPIPDDVLVYVNESLAVSRGATVVPPATGSIDSHYHIAGGSTVYLSVIPISYIEYTRLMSKPFKRPTHYQAWRLINGKEVTSGSGTDATTTFNHRCDLVAGPSDIPTKYIARYIKRPTPIILADLETEGLSIDGEDSTTECELDPIIHQDILQRAVELAKAAYTGDLSSQVGLGSTSQTNVGVPSYNGGRRSSND